MTTIEQDLISVAAGRLQIMCHRAAASWWKPGDTEQPFHFSNKLMLIVSEIAEAMEGDRKGINDDKLPHRSMREVELADAVIRIFDLAGGYNMDLAGAIVEKLEYNATRQDHQASSRAAAGGKKY